MRKGNINNKSKEEIKFDEDLQASLAELNVNREEQQEDKGIEQSQQEKQETITTTKNNRLKIIILIIIGVLCVGITAALLARKYMNASKIVSNNTISNNNTVTEIQSKEETKDKKYLVSYTDMYTLNPLTTTEKSYEQKATKKQAKISISYVEIAGLQNKDLEKRINDEIKENAFYYSDKLSAKQEYFSYTTVNGSFCNILSVGTNITVYEGEELVMQKNFGLNYNLVTGEQIKFLDLFASNTPMNSIIYDLEYERLAWDTEYNFDMSDEEWDKATNMDRRDTSEYEDRILEVVNRYKKIDKDKIEFSVSPSIVSVTLPIGDDGEVRHYTIDLYKYIDYVIMYKKYLSDAVVFESIPSNKLLVFNDMLGYVPEYYKIESDNLFISIFSHMQDEYMKEEERAEVEKFSQEAVNKKKELMENHTQNILSEVRKLASKNKNKGYMARFLPYCYIDVFDNDYGEETLIYISLDGAIEEMNIDYYKENAFKLLAKLNVGPKVSVDDFLVGNLDNSDKNIKSLLYNEDEEDVVDLRGYYTLDGTLVATSYEEVEKYINDKYTEPEPEPEVEVEEVPEEQPEVEIYKEEQ